MEIRFSALSMVWPDGIRALDRIDLTVPSGQFCVFLGHSGAGKSTLLRCVNGLETPSEGAVQVNGRSLDKTNLTNLRKQIGMVHQHFGLVPRASGAKNVMAGAVAELPLWRILTGIYPVALKRRTCELLQQVGLEQAHMQRRAEQLSGGQQQRLGLARAFMPDPAIILADEPVASLDPAISREVLALLREQARRRGTTVLCSLHQVELAQEFADRIVALHCGRIIFDGTPAKLNDADVRMIYARTNVPRTVVEPIALQEAG